MNNNNLLAEISIGKSGNKTVIRVRLSSLYENRARVFLPKQSYFDILFTYQAYPVLFIVVSV